MTDEELALMLLHCVRAEDWLAVEILTIELIERHSHDQKEHNLTNGEED